VTKRQIIQWAKDSKYNEQKTDNTATKRQIIQWPKDLYYLSFGHCVICPLVIVLCLLVIALSVFWSLYYLSFGHGIICLLVIVLSVFWSWYCLSFGHCVICLLVQKTDNTGTKRQKILWPKDIMQWPKDR
jgi:hypothetical protein